MIHRSLAQEEVAMPTCPVCSQVYESAAACPRCGAPAPAAGDYRTVMPPVAPPPIAPSPSMPPYPGQATAPGQMPPYYSPYPSPYAAPPIARPGTVTAVFVLFLIMAVGGVFGIVSNVLVAVTPLSRYAPGGTALLIAMIFLGAVITGLATWGATLAWKGAKNTRIPAIGILVLAVIIFIVNIVSNVSTLSVSGPVIPIIIVVLVHSATAKAYLKN